MPQSDPEEHLHGEPDGDVQKNKGHGDKPGGHQYRPEGEPDRPVRKGLQSPPAVVTVLEGAGVGVTSSSPVPYVSTI